MRGHADSVDAEAIFSRYKLALKESPFWNDKTTENGLYISGLKCPSCEKLEAWAYSKKPAVHYLQSTE